MLSRIEIQKFRFAVIQSETERAGGFLADIPAAEKLADAAAVNGADVLVCPFNAFPEIELVRELSGGGEYIRRLCEISESINGAVFCGVTTRIVDIKHIGVVVCNKGMPVDIVDRTVDLFGDGYRETDKIKIFASDAGKIGLLIDTDCLLEKNWEKIAPFSDVVLCIAQSGGERVREEIRLFAAVYGVSYLYVDNNSLEWRE